MKPQLSFVLLAVSSLACHRTGGSPTSGSAQAATPVDGASLDHYSAHGVVKSIDPEKKQLSIAHDDIPGFMKAMTMPFDVKDASLLGGITVGDSVDFSFTEDEGRLVIERLTKR